GTAFTARVTSFCRNVEGARDTVRIPAHRSLQIVQAVADRPERGTAVCRDAIVFIPLKEAGDAGRGAGRSTGKTVRAVRRVGLQWVDAGRLGGCFWSPVRRGPPRRPPLDHWLSWVWTRKRTQRTRRTHFSPP